MSLLPHRAVATAGGGSTIEAQPGPDPTGTTIVLDPQVRRATKPGCVPVRRIEIRGVVLIDAESLGRKLELVATACIGNDEAKAILSAINEAYADRGYVTTQGYLPEQDFRRSGTLVVNVIAGRIEAVEYKEGRSDEALPLKERAGKSWREIGEANGPWSLLKAVSRAAERIDDPLDDFQILPRNLKPDPKLWGSLITASGDVLQIDEIQQGVDQINRVASGRAQAKLEPGERPATSRVVIENASEDSFRLTAGYEINGSALSGSGETVPSRLRLDAAKDNLIGVNDAWRWSYAGGLDSNEVRAAFSVPFRRLTFSFDGGYSESLSQLTPGVELFSRTGTLTGDLGYLLWRDRDRQVLADSSLSWRTNERFVNGADLSPQVVSSARVGLTEIRTFTGYALQVSYGAGLSHGLDAFGAIEDPASIDRSTPRAQFWKIDAQAALSKAFADLGTLRVDVSGQWTPHPLYSDDQLVLGSVTTVRGFTNSASRVDQGVLVRAEFAPAIPAAAILGDRREDLPFLEETLSGMQPYLFSDFGAGRDVANRENLQRASVGAGVRYKHGRINLDVSVGQPVYRHGGAPAREWRSSEGYLTLSVKLL